VGSKDDLGGKAVFVRETSSYYEHLIALNADRKRAGQPEILVSKINENLEDEDILEMVNAGLLPWAVVDRFDANVWAQVFDDLKVRDDIAISDAGDTACALPARKLRSKEMQSHSSTTLRQCSRTSPNGA
jgi:membrane-bound lytic murein transglycosylase MltF